MAEQMKLSGIDWIGDIPEHWDAKKVKYVISDIKDGTHGTFERVESGELLLSAKNVFDDGIRIGENESEISISDYKSIISNGFPKRNDVLLCCVGTIGRCCVYEYDQSIAFQRSVAFLRPLQQTNAQYLKYALQSDSTLVQEQLQINKSAQDGLYMGSVRELIIPYPNSKSEQQSIADFLDRKCAQIDSIAADLEKQIALLQQYKKSLITETVTKGLNKSVPMKDSGVEWTSKIPCHWEIKRFKYLCEYITDGSHFSPETTDEGYPYITAADVKGVGLDYDAAKKISQQDFISLQKAGCQPRKGDVLLVKDGATTGRIGMVTSEKPCVVLSSVAILRAPDNMDARYLRYLMESDFVQAQIQASMAGSAMPRTVLSKIINYWGITCPKEEQKEICDFLDRKCGCIETVIETKQVQQSTIQQHKKSLIYEYVTGKKRVKEVQ